MDNVAQIIGTTVGGHIIYELYGPDVWKTSTDKWEESNECLSFDFIALFVYKHIKVLQKASEKGIAFGDIKLENALLPRPRNDNGYIFPSIVDRREGESFLFVAILGKRNS